MIRAALALLFTLVAGISSAGTAFSGAPNQTAKFAAYYPYRKIRICAIPDTQNQIAGNSTLDVTTIFGPPDTCTEIVGKGNGTANCAEPYCTQPKWCGTDWWNTGRMIWENQTKILIGDYANIDWGNATGGDPTPRNHWWNNHGALACDVIISLGDINDYPDNATTYTLSNSSADDLHAYSNSVAMWSAIARSGVPAIITRGNHDPLAVTQQLRTDSGISTGSYSYAVEPTRQMVSAIKFMTNSGKQMCVVAANSDSAAAVPDNRENTTETTFIKNNIGCGAALPTIIVGHEMVIPTSVSDCTSSTLAQGILADPNTAGDPVFMALGGHWLTMPGCAELVAAGTEAGNRKDYLHFYFNQQETATHFYNGFTYDTYPFGVSPGSNGGGQLLFITVDPRYNTVNVRNWSPYFETSGDPSVVDPTAFAVNPAALLNQTFTFNFDARFP